MGRPQFNVSYTQTSPYWAAIWIVHDGNPSTHGIFIELSPFFLENGVQHLFYREQVSGGLAGAQGVLAEVVQTQTDLGLLSGSRRVGFIVGCDDLRWGMEVINAFQQSVGHPPGHFRRWVSTVVVHLFGANLVKDRLD